MTTRTTWPSDPRGAAHHFASDIATTAISLSRLEPRGRHLGSGTGHVTRIIGGPALGRIGSHGPNLPDGYPEAGRPGGRISKQRVITASWPTRTVRDPGTSSWTAARHPDGSTWSWPFGRPQPRLRIFYPRPQRPASSPGQRSLSTGPPYRWIEDPSSCPGAHDDGAGGGREHAACGPIRHGAGHRIPLATRLPGHLLRPPTGTSPWPASN